jgi:hypothetical protein
MEAPRRSRVGCYIGVAVLVIFVVGAIVAVKFFRDFLNSDEGKRMVSAIQTQESFEEILPEVLGAFQAYENEKGAFPATLTELEAYGAPKASLDTVKEKMKYTPPAKDADENTVVLDSGAMDFIKGGSMRMQVTKNLKVYSVLRNPLPIEPKASKPAR